MDVMRYLLAGLGLAVVTVGQVNPNPGAANGTVREPAKVASEPSGTGMAPVRFGANGWPVGLGNAKPAPVAETKRPPTATARRTSKRDKANAALPDSSDVLVAQGTSAEPLASGMQLDSPMHEVFRATRTPGALHDIGGVEVFWRLTIHGTHGEIIGIRDITHIADLQNPTRDRLEDNKGRVFTRDGNQIHAQRNGIPYETLLAEAGSQLELFGMQLRMPWCFGEGRHYAVMRREVALRRGESLVKLNLRRRAPANEAVFGPEANPKPRDQFELLFEPTTGLPRELVHRFASSGQKRHVLLDDWQDKHGVRMPHRRIYVDAAGRATTTVELRRITPRRVSDRDFRLQ
ncbi:MAG: hypothetical protein ACI85K_003570 [Hyphomicrobiaceae bacterium]|jgi:hypothetical protein